jgi:hypothetical protein
MRLLSFAALTLCAILSACAAPTRSAEAPAVAPAAGGTCDKALFMRWETGKVFENCMSAPACVVDERLTTHSCAGKPDSAACMHKCLSFGVTMIAEMYHTEPPDLAVCIDCVSAGYAKYMEKCGASCPSCPRDTPEEARCAKCADEGKFFDGCLK